MNKKCFGQQLERKVRIIEKIVVAADTFNNFSSSWLLSRHFLSLMNALGYILTLLYLLNSTKKIHRSWLCKCSRHVLCRKECRLCHFPLAAELNMSLILFKRLLLKRSAACIKTTWWNSMYEITMKNHLSLNLQLLHTFKPKISLPFKKPKPKMTKLAVHSSGCVCRCSYFV